MPVLTAPAPTATEIELPTIAFFGRSLAEYTRFFSLDIHALRGRSVLDVAAGPSSFTAEACRRDIDAVAVDPLYEATPESLAVQVQLDYARMFTQMREKRRLFRFGSPRTIAASTTGITQRHGSAPARYFSSFDEAETERRTAAQRFLSDYEAQAGHGRYLAASLPRLPFLDGAFDLVLCAHLLFTYAAQFDFQWHLAACRELARVSTGEVRIHPLCGLGGRPYSELSRLQRELLAAGITSSVVSVDYEFFAGSSSMLVLKPK